MVPEENLVFDPEYYMRELVRYTHYLPPEWVGKLHSQKVGNRLCKADSRYTQTLAICSSSRLLYSPKSCYRSS